MLTVHQHERYMRQMNLPGFGALQQERLLQSRVVIVGAGGLGCPMALYLAGAGVGHISVVDDDVVSISNLHRQIAFSATQINSDKAVRLVEAMRGIDATLDFKSSILAVSESNYEELLHNATLVVDGTDNFASRFLIADACYLLKIPYLQAAVFQFQAQIMLCVPDLSPCYRCVFDGPPVDGGLKPCSETGVLGSTVGTAGTIAATEAIKFLSGMKNKILGRMIVYDGVEQSINHIELNFDDGCRLCSRDSVIKQVHGLSKTCLAASATGETELPADQVKLLLRDGALLIDVREHDEFVRFHLPDALSIPHSQLEQKIDELRCLDTPAIAYCQRGRRSMQFLEQLEARGINGFFSLAGGLDAWQE